MGLSPDGDSGDPGPGPEPGGTPPCETVHSIPGRETYH
jgi:hypothetical protein